MKMKKIFFILNALLGAALALTPFVLFPVCGPMPNGKYMMCHYSGIFIAGMGALIVVLSLLALWGHRKRWAASLSGVLSIVAALLCYLVPMRIIVIGDKAGWGWECGLCKAADMACHTTTMPAVTVLVSALVLVNVVALIHGFVGRGR